MSLSKINFASSSFFNLQQKTLKTLPAIFIALIGFSTTLFASYLFQYVDQGATIKSWHWPVLLIGFTATGFLSSYFFFLKKMQGKLADTLDTLEHEVAVRREFEARLNLALDIGNGTIWDWDIPTGEISFGPRFYSMLGYEPGELPSHIKYLEKIVHMDDLQKVRSALIRHLKGTTPLYEHETKLLKKSGQTLWTLDRGKVISRDEDGKALRMVGVCTDITEYKQRENAIHLQGEITANMAEGVFLTRASDGVIVYTNRRLEEEFGYNRGELIGKPVSILNAKTDDKSPEEVTQGIIDVLEKGQIWRGEVCNIKKDGSIFWGMASISTYHHTQHRQVWLTTHTDISERKVAEQTLRDSEEQFRTIFDQSSDSILVINPSDGRIVAFNNNSHKNLGYTRREFKKLTISDIEDPMDGEEIQDQIKRIRKRRRKVFQTKHRTKESEIRDVQVTTRTIHLKGEEYLLFVLQDITDQKEAEEQQQLASAVYNNASEAIMVTDADNNIISTNPAFTKITGYTLDEVLGKSPKCLKSDKHNDAFYQKMRDSINETDHWEGEVWEKRKKGEVHPIWLSVAAIKDQEGDLLYYASLFSDITERKANAEKLRFQAYYDTLTSLPNRRLLKDRLSQALHQSKRTSRKVGLLFIDLDHFKHVNDTLGHLAGDKVLKKAAKRLQSSVREADTVARSGGDEFQVVLPDIGGREEATLVAEKIIKKMSLPFQLGGREIFLGVSIGITIAPNDGEDAFSLMRNADLAMYKAKSSGRNKYSFFNQRMGSVAKNRALLEWGLKRAITQKEFVVFYQPVVNLRTLKTVALEALVRWHHPVKGLLMPDQFIQIAEESGTIKELGHFVLNTACKQMAAWRKIYGVDTALSVNMSSRQFIFNDFLSPIQNALEESTLPPESLIIEVTESLTLDPVEKAVDKLWKLKDAGINIAIDDFGTGYSSLSYLSRFPIDRLKIDKSFIQNVYSNPQKRHLVEAMIRMGQSLKMEVIAEGIEQQEDFSYLTEFGCNSAQGYYFSKPLSVEHYEAVLEKEIGIVE